MSIVLATNVGSLTAQRNLATARLTLETSFNRLSSGFRINTAADDASGLAISESLKSQIGSFGVAERNANNGISMVQTAEGALGQIGNILSRLRELAVQSANGDLASTDRGYIQTEFGELVAEVDRVSNAAMYNGLSLLSGGTTTIAFQVGINNTVDDRISVNLGGVSTSTLGISASSVSGSDATNAQQALGAIDTAIQSVSNSRANFGAKLNRFGYAVENIRTFRTNLSAANSRIRDADIAEESAVLTKSQVLQQAATAVLAQANQSPQLALKLLG